MASDIAPFLKPPPRLVPSWMWRLLARPFLTVDAHGARHFRSAPPASISWDRWRGLANRLFVADIYPKNRLRQEPGPRLLREALAVAPDAWLFSGTLLGCVRDRQLIPWDLDIDLGYPCELASEELVERFHQAGFNVLRTRRYDRPDLVDYVPEAMGRYSKLVMRKEGMKVELYCFARGLDGRYYYLAEFPQLFVIDYHLVYPQKKVPLYGIPVNIPVQAEAQLDYMYGEEWRLPKPLWIRSAEHYRRREGYTIELEDDGNPKWSLAAGRKVIADQRERL